MTAHPALLSLIAARADWHRLIDGVTCADALALLRALPDDSLADLPLFAAAE